MKTASVAEIESGLHSFLDRLDEEPVIITRDGKPVAALVSVSDQEAIERFLPSRPVDLRRLLEEANERITRTGGMTHDEFWTAVENRYGGGDNAAPEPGQRNTER